jgi:DNA-binding YbaB/EbfC family protein
MFDNVDFSQMGKMFEQVQESAKKIQQESENRTFTAKSGGGMVEVTINGINQVTDITFDDSLLDDKDSLQILLISSINDALKMVEEDKKNQATQMLGGLGSFMNKG